MEEITNFTKAGGGCGKCIGPSARDPGGNGASGTLKIKKVAEQTAKRMTTLQKIKKIEEALEREIRPALRKDGGDIELVDVDGDFVTVSLARRLQRAA